MKIGFFTDGYLPQINGVATSVDELKDSLASKGHTVYIIAPKYPKFKDKDKHIFRLKSVKLWRNPELRVSYMFPDTIFQKVLKLDMDIIHGFSGGATPSLGLTLAKIKKKPYVFTYNTRLNQYTHYVLNGKLIRPKTVERVAKFYCNVCDHVVAPADYVKKELIGFGVKKPISVIPNGINTNKFKPGNKEYLKNKLNLPKNSKIVLYVGRLAKEKSIDFLIKAFASIKDENVYFVIAGDGPVKQNLQKLTKKLKLGPRVIFLGMVEYKDVSYVYNGADIFVFSSKTETQGMVILEAMSSGLPVLAVNDRVFEEFINSPKEGILVEKSQKMFVKNLKNLLEDEKLRKSIAQNARLKAEKYSLEEVAKKFENLYKSLI